VRYEFIQAHQQEFPIQRMCQVLQVSASGFYAWLKRPPSQRAQANEQLMRQIALSHESSRQTYGSPRIWAELQDLGFRCGIHRVARLMRNMGLKTRYRRRFRTTTQENPKHPVAPNHLAQNFTATAPDEKWLVDISYIDTDEGWLYLAGVLDVFSRKIVGWSMAERMSKTLVIDALKMAYGRRNCPKLHHSDKGSQYTSHDYLELLSQREVLMSMSGTGNCYDNAMLESFWGTLKTECASERYPSRQAARQAIFEYIEVWYNRQRRHSALGYLSPEAFEQCHL
jgi:putative transposase